MVWCLSISMNSGSADLDITYIGLGLECNEPSKVSHRLNECDQ